MKNKSPKPEKKEYTSKSSNVHASNQFPKPELEDK